MKISNRENVSLHDCLFKNRENYNKWAPMFYLEFVKVHSNRIGKVAGVMTPHLVNVEDELDKEFFSWLQRKGITL